MYNVYVIGKDVYNNWNNLGYINEINDDVLTKIKEHINKKYNLEVKDFYKRNFSYHADTSRKDVKVYIEENNPLF